MSVKTTTRPTLPPATTPPPAPQATLSRSQDGSLKLDAGAGNDKVDVRKGTEGNYQVTVNGETHNLTRDQMARLTINGGSGRDFIRVAADVDVPVKVTGGSGSDVILNASGQAQVSGGAGADAVLSVGHARADAFQTARTTGSFSVRAFTPASTAGVTAGLGSPDLKAQMNAGVLAAGTRRSTSQSNMPGASVGPLGGRSSGTVTDDLAKVRQNAVTLKEGSSGAAVAGVQTMLNKLTLNGMPVSGVYDSRTTEAVKDYQRSHGLTADGKVGPKTLEWMEAEAYGGTGPQLDSVRNNQLTLKHGGQSGPAVPSVQRMLKGVGIQVPLNGVYGPETKEAVKKFQREHGLTADGKVGPNTLKQLESESKKLGVGDDLPAEVQEGKVQGRNDEDKRDMLLSSKVSTADRIANLKRLTQIDGNVNTKSDRFSCGVQSVVAGIYMSKPAELSKIAGHYLNDRGTSSGKKAALASLAEKMGVSLSQARSSLQAIQSGKASPKDIATMSGLIYEDTRIQANLASQRDGGLDEGAMKVLCKDILKDQCGVKIPPMEVELVDRDPDGSHEFHFVGQYPDPRDPTKVILFDGAPKVIDGKADVVTGEAKADADLLQIEPGHDQVSTVKIGSDGAVTVIQHPGRE